MATAIITAIRETATKQKLLALSPFPDLQQVVNLCHSEESVRANSSTLQGMVEVIAVHLDTRSTGQHQQQQNASGTRQKVRCNSCGQFSHRRPACPAVGRNCNWCDATGHFTPVCPVKLAEKPSIQPSTPIGSQQSSITRNILIGRIQTSRRTILTSMNANN